MKQVLLLSVLLTLLIGGLASFLTASYLIFSLKVFVIIFAFTSLVFFLMHHDDIDHHSHHLE